eukprot:gene4878-biopygen1618
MMCRCSLLLRDVQPSLCNYLSCSVGSTKSLPFPQPGSIKSHRRTVKVEIHNLRGAKIAHLNFQCPATSALYLRSSAVDEAGPETTDFGVGLQNENGKSPQIKSA